MRKKEKIFTIVSWLHSVGCTAYRLFISLKNRSIITLSRTESRVFPDRPHTPSLSTPQGPTPGHGWDCHTQTCPPTHKHTHAYAHIVQTQKHQCKRVR